MVIMKYLNQQVTYTVSGNSISDTHTAHCAYCTTQFDPETHTFDANDVCTACGVQKSTTIYTVSVYLPRNEGGGYDNSPLELQMIDGTKFNMPSAPDRNIPANLEFAGWLEGIPASMDNIEAKGSETLLPVGTERIIHADAVFTARVFHSRVKSKIKNERNIPPKGGDYIKFLLIFALS